MIQVSRSHRLARERLQPEAIPEPPPRPCGGSDRRQAEPRPNKRQSRIVRKPSAIPFMARWATMWINAGHPKLFIRTKRALAWLAYSGYQFYMMARALVGGRISHEQFAARMVVCEGCPSQQKRLVYKRPFVKLFCGSCGCPQWWLSELGPVGDKPRRRPTRRYKNYLLKWECPHDKHERLGDPPAWAGIIEEEAQWVEMASAAFRLPSVPSKTESPMRNALGRPAE